jgi:hypothetical protein
MTEGGGDVVVKQSLGRLRLKLIVKVVDWLDY